MSADGDSDTDRGTVEVFRNGVLIGRSAGIVPQPRRVPTTVKVCIHS